MSTTWDSYPADYRSREVQFIQTAVRAGECVSLVGLSGAGKSNLLGFIAHRLGKQASLSFASVDCNRLVSSAPTAFFRLVRLAMAEGQALPGWEADPIHSDAGELAALEADLDRYLSQHTALCLLFDRFDTFAQAGYQQLYGNLRALRDRHKYVLTFVTATRRPLDPNTELAELFYANTLWLGPLSESDACWNVIQYAGRKGLHWDQNAIQRLVEISWKYPALLRAVCEAYAAGIDLEQSQLEASPPVHRRLVEFWADEPGEEELRLSGLAGHPFLTKKHLLQPGLPAFDTSHLTAKEHLLLAYFLAHPEVVCEKDDLMRAVWPEDRIFLEGVRDDSLAQLVRRLRKKIELDPDQPQYIHTVPGRGYRFVGFGKKADF